jgi:hypothetical protein
MNAHPKPVLYMDFDGVLNFFGSRSAYTKRSNAPGYLRRNSVYDIETNSWYGLNWSAELVRKLGELDADWLWLTSWREKAPALLDPALQVASVGSLDWDFSEATGWNHDLKWLALLADQDANPRPFVWVDDEATRAFDETALLVKVPYLLVKPDPNFGMTRADLDNVREFLASV